MTNLERTRAFLKSLETRDGTTLDWYAPDLVQREFPNRLSPQAVTRGLDAMRAAAERGKEAVRGEKYEVLSAIEHGEEVAVEALWSATLNKPLGKLAAGDTMRAWLGIFFTWRDGKIVSQRNYDCFEPF